MSRLLRGEAGEEILDLAAWRSLVTDSVEAGEGRERVGGGGRGSGSSNHKL